MTCDHCYCLDVPPDTIRRKPHMKCCKCGDIRNRRMDVEMTPTHCRAIRGRLRVSQAGLARLVGVHRVTVTRWETGRRAIPAPTAKLLGLLLGGWRPVETTRAVAQARKSFWSEPRERSSCSQILTTAKRS
jgi:DNA-binding transcriptional regulator YiaG